MKQENKLIKELEDLKHDCQYLQEMKKVIECEDMNLTRIYSNLLQMKNMDIKTYNLDKKVKNILEALVKEEEQLIYTLENKQKIHDIINTLEQPYKNILYFRYVCTKSFDAIDKFF